MQKTLVDAKTLEGKVYAMSSTEEKLVLATSKQKVYILCPFYLNRNK